MDPASEHDPDRDEQLLHDLFVPNYTALATVTPSRLVLIGVYILFAPTAIANLVFMSQIIHQQQVPLVLRAVVAALCALLTAVSILIIVMTHLRYAAARRQHGLEVDDADNAGDDAEDDDLSS